MSLLVARRLGISADLGGRRIAVLRDVSFDLAPSRILGVVGESGAGKSMLGRLIGRVLPPLFRATSGALTFQGQDLLAMEAAEMRALLGRRIAFIPQEPSAALNPVLTVAQQFGEHLARIGIPASDRADVMREALASVRLTDPDGALGRYPHQLSGGECQRVLIAIAFSSRPALVIADEPTTALDVTSQARVVEVLRELQSAHGTGVLFITHDLRLAGQICDDLMVMYAGDVVERGPAGDLLTSPRHPYARALRDANPPLRGARRRLTALPDVMPGLMSFADLDGCRFAPRCPTADPLCAAAPPVWRTVGPDHVVACSPICENAADTRLGALLPPPPPPTAAPILAVTALTKTYRRGWPIRRETLALEPLSFSIAPGEIVGVVGESGSGKSTLAKLLVGLEAPSAGRIAIDGCEIGPADRLLRSRSLQMVFQDATSALNPRRRVGDLVTQSWEAAGHAGDPAARRARASEMLSAVGLSADMADRYPAQLSGGQKQRVNIARALCGEPRLLIADEIVSGLDVSVQAQLLNLLLQLRDQRGIAVLFISHDLSVVRYLCQRVLVLYRGRLMESGETDAVLDHPTSDYSRALISAAPPDPAPPIRQASPVALHPNT